MPFTIPFLCAADRLAAKVRELLSKNTKVGTFYPRDAAAADQQARQNLQELLQAQEAALGQGSYQPEEQEQQQNDDDEFGEDGFGDPAAAGRKTTYRRGFGSAVGLAAVAAAAAAAAAADEEEEAATAGMQLELDDNHNSLQRAGQTQRSRQGSKGIKQQRCAAGWQGKLSEYDRQAQQLAEELRLLAGGVVAAPASPPHATASTQQQQQPDGHLRDADDDAAASSPAAAADYDRQAQQMAEELALLAGAVAGAQQPIVASPELHEAAAAAAESAGAVDYDRQAQQLEQELAMLAGVVAGQAAAGAQQPAGSSGSLQDDVGQGDEAAVAAEVFGVGHDVLGDVGGGSADDEDIPAAKRYCTSAGSDLMV